MITELILASGNKGKIAEFQHLLEELNIPVEKIETLKEITALGKDLRTFRGGITDENTLIGFNMAVALCNKLSKTT